MTDFRTLASLFLWHDFMFIENDQIGSVYMTSFIPEHHHSDFNTMLSKMNRACQPTGHMGGGKSGLGTTRTSIVHITW